MDLSGFDKLARFGAALDGGAVERSGPIEMEEVSPGVWAAAKPRPQLSTRLGRQLSEARAFAETLRRRFAEMGDDS